MTLHDLENMTKEMLTPSDVAGVLGCNAYTLTLQAKADPAKLGFPVIVMGTRVRIPRRPFINFVTRGVADD